MMAVGFGTAGRSSSLAIRYGGVLDLIRSQSTYGTPVLRAASVPITEPATEELPVRYIAHCTV